MYELFHLGKQIFFFFPAAVAKFLSYYVVRKKATLKLFCEKWMQKLVTYTLRK